MPNNQNTIIIIILVACVMSFFLLKFLFNRTSKHDQETMAAGSAIAQIDGILSSVETYQYEKRPGMRKVRVQVKYKVDGEAAREIVITEWIPVVLLGRLTEGSSVRLIRDPLGEGRLTLGL